MHKCINFCYRISDLIQWMHWYRLQ